MTTWRAGTLALAVCLPVSARAQAPAAAAAPTVAELVARNTTARGGAARLRTITTLRIAGQMDLGRGMLVPYVLEQKRPAKLRLEYVFDGETAIQSSDGHTGWKELPFLGRKGSEDMTAEELRESAGPGEIDGLLFNYARRGHRVELVGREKVGGRDAFTLRVTLPGGAVRLVSLDAETGRELKLSAQRRVAGRDRRVETFYYDWLASDGLALPRRLETRMEGVKGTHVLTVDSVSVNPPIDDARFARPVASSGPRHTEAATR